MPRATNTHLRGVTRAVMKPVEDIRRDNLNLLIQEAGNASRLALITGVPAPYISQVSRGVARTGGGKPRVMGPDIARKLEQKMGKPTGWMDADHSALNVMTDLNGREGQLVGLFRLLSDADQAELVNNLTRRLRQSPTAAPSVPTKPVRH